MTANPILQHLTEWNPVGRQLRVQMLPKIKSNSVTVESGIFRYIVSESPSDDDAVALILNIQNENNGSVLCVTGLSTSRVPVMESKFYVGRTATGSVLPRHVETLINSGIQDGWCPHDAGVSFIMRVSNAEVFGDVT